VQRIEQPKREQLAAMVAKPGAAVEQLRRRVVALGLEVERTHAVLQAGGPHGDERQLAEPLAAVLRPQVEVVEEGVAAAVFEAEAERHHHVADRLASGHHQPDPTEAGVGEELGEGVAGPLAVEGVARLGVELRHQLYEHRQIGGGGSSKGGHGPEPNRPRRPPAGRPPARR
jgi:hypothetical protein